MNETPQDDEISLIDLFAVLWHHKVMIIAITLAAMIGVVVYAAISLKLPPEESYLPNVYTPKALMLINNESSAGGGMASMLSGLGGLGGLAGLAGVSKGSTFSDLAIYIVGTNSMLDTVVDEFDLITRWKIDTPKKKAEHPRADSRKALKKKLVAEYDKASGVFSISFTDTDPVFAQSVVNFCVRYLDKRYAEMGLDKNVIEKENLELNIANTFQEIQNLEQQSQRVGYSVASGMPATLIPAITLESNRIAMELEAQRQVYTQLKVQYELLKVSMASEKPIFQILELAEVPDQKSGPGRGLLCIVVTFAAAFFSIFLAFAVNAIANIRQDPEAMAKLRGKNTKKVLGAKTAGEVI
ncbi:LPS biosynthesis protein [Spirochaetia bacterium]|nr:LPS biosynthesis protein [Spirochaetia bacterium]